MARTYATLNPADKSLHMLLSGGNLTGTWDGVGALWNGARVTIPFSGKEYFEFTSTFNCLGGVGDSGMSLVLPVGGSAQSAGVFAQPGGGSNTMAVTGMSSTGTTYTTPEIMGVAVNNDTKEIWFQRASGVWIDGNPVTGVSPSVWGWAASVLYAAISGFGFTVETINCGASAFAYPVPSGFREGIYTGEDTSLPVIETQYRRRR